MLNKKVPKKSISLILSLVVVLGSLFAFSASPMSVCAATQATYYVSPTGSDSNAGTISAPFLTITKAQSVVKTINSNMSGDVYVYLRGGNYSITSTINFGTQDSGTNGHTIYYEAYPGETPVLNGATKVTGWTQYSGNIYQATLNRSTKLRNLYVNDQRANMTSKTVTAQGGYGTYSVTSGQAAWAWLSGSGFDGVQYNSSDVPTIASNQDDLEIVNGSTWNENVVCVRSVITSGSYRVLQLQQPYGLIAQTPGWGAAFVATGTHTIYNAFEFMTQSSAGQFYFNKTTKTLYYCIRPGENMATADVEAPSTTTLINVAGTSTTNRVNNLTFQGITFENTDWSLENVGGSYGKSTVQGANAFIAYGDGNYHNSDYDIIDTLPGMVQASSASAINFIGDTVKHGGSDGISEVNDVINSNITGCYITDITSSGITIGHPQDIYVDHGGAHEKYAVGVKGICTNDSITNNMLYNISMAPGFGGGAGITAFFVAYLNIEYNQIQTTAYNGINLGWGWCNFTDSTTCHNNTCSFNRLINTLARLHDSGAIYTIGQQPGDNVNSNYVQGIPPATSGPTYGLHNDEGSAYITENDNVLNIDPGVTYSINCENYNGKHDLTILRTYATVCKMGVNPPNSVIDLPIAVPDNVWPQTPYNTVLNAGIQEAYRSLIPNSLLSTQDYVFPASCATSAGATVNIRSSGNSTNNVWFAPAGTSTFAAGPNMTTAGGTATTISAPTTAGTYYMYVLNSSGAIIGKSVALLRTSSSSQIAASTYSSGSGIGTETCSEGGLDVCNIQNGSYAVYNNVNLSSGPTTFQARVASATSGGSIQVRLDSTTGTLIGTCAVTGTGGWQTYVTDTCTLSGATGTHNIYLVFTGGTGYLLNLEWFNFASSSTTYEAENAALTSPAEINTNHTGYTGTGFVDGYYNSSTANTTFTVNVPTAKTYTIVLRYSAGGGTSTNTGLVVNGTLLKNITCNATTDWNTWATETETVSLNAGSNTISYKAESASTLCANLDNITVS